MHEVLRSETVDVLDLKSERTDILATQNTLIARRAHLENGRQNQRAGSGVKMRNELGKAILRDFLRVSAWRILSVCVSRVSAFCYRCKSTGLCHIVQRDAGALYEFTFKALSCKAGADGHDLRLVS